ncbi:axoneme-associated protein mst101(2)-like [Ptychodera flava]|uniref:axoneme-associated protein mst101(2)-like n=1 Tax=Ptychodera flava TaxID=63121 RepID=UPI00396A9B20
MRFATAVVLAAACLVAVQAVNQEKKEEIKRKKITALQQKKDHLVMEKKKEEERMQKKMAALREVKHLAVKTRIETPVEKRRPQRWLQRTSARRKRTHGKEAGCSESSKAKMHSTGEADVGVPKERKDAETTEMKRKLVPHVGSLLRNLKDAMFDDQTEHITDEKYLSLKEKISAELRKTAVEIEGKRKELKKAKAILDNDEQTMTEGKAAKRNKQTRHKNPEKHASTLLEEKLRQLKRKKATNAKAEKLLAQAAKKKKAMKVVEKTSEQGR